MTVIIFDVQRKMCYAFRRSGNHNGMENLKAYEQQRIGGKSECCHGPAVPAAWLCGAGGCTDGAWHPDQTGI